jgi:hypothetical protein
VSLKVCHPIPQLQLTLDAVKGCLTRFLCRGSLTFVEGIKSWLDGLGDLTLGKRAKDRDKESLLGIIEFVQIRGMFISSGDELFEGHLGERPKGGSIVPQ